MSDSTPTATADAPATDAAPKPTAPPAAPEFNYPPATPLADMTGEQQAEYWREKAQKHEKLWKSSTVDPKELEALRAKAQKADEIEESQKSEQQKLADKLAAAEARASELETKALRAEVAADKGVPANLLSGSTLEELTASADALVAFRGEKPKPDFGGGDRGEDVGSKAGQLSESDMKRMTPEEITKAHEQGRFSELLKST